MNADGSGVTALTHGLDDDEMLTWSPDGKYIAFKRNGDIYRMNTTDGSKRTAARELSGKIDMLSGQIDVLDWQ